MRYWLPLLITRFCNLVFWSLNECISPYDGLMLLVLSRAPAFAAAPVSTSSTDQSRTPAQNQVSSNVFRHSLSGLYGIKAFDSRPTQPYTDFDILYSKAHQAQAELETICKSTALLTNSDALFAGVKSQARAEEKIDLELDGDVSRITDLARATIIANDVESLVEVYEALSREADVVKVKTNSNHRLILATVI